jgi:RHS repeat-associated protein
LVDLHGDVIAPASPADTSWNLSATQTDTNEFGVPSADAPATGSRYDYLGTDERARDVNSGLQLMGSRVYNPVTGRFLQMDPVLGGSANSYDYCSADPVNCSDLNGQAVPWAWLSSPKAKAAVKWIHAMAVLKAKRVRAARSAAAALRWIYQQERDVAEMLANIVLYHSAKGCTESATVTCEYGEQPAALYAYGGGPGSDVGQSSGDCVLTSEGDCAGHTTPWNPVDAISQILNVTQCSPIGAGAKVVVDTPAAWLFVVTTASACGLAAYNAFHHH